MRFEDETQRRYEDHRWSHAQRGFLSREEYIAAIEKEDPDEALRVLAAQVKAGVRSIQPHSGADIFPGWKVIHDHLEQVKELADLAVASTVADLTDAQVQETLRAEGLEHVITDYGPFGQRRMAHIIRRKRWEGR